VSQSRAVKWQWQDAPGALAAWAVSICSLLVIVNPSMMLRTGLAVLTPLVVLLAFLSSLQSGSCGACRASRRRQVRTQGDAVVRAASRTSTGGAGVKVATGWEVEVPVEYTCTRCGNARRVASTFFVPLAEAATVGEAALIGSRSAGAAMP
jgi:hypothetical protein